MKKRFLIVGRSFSGIEKAIARRGDEFTVLKDPADIDFTEAVDSLAEIDGVISVYENYVVDAARIAKKLGLPGMPIRAAELATDKALMRQAFSQAPRPISPAYAVVKNKKDLLDFADSHSYPLIIKPANLTKSLLVSKSGGQKELLDNFERTSRMIDSTYARYAPNQVPKILVEEFLEGSAHSVEAFVDRSGRPLVLEQVVDYQTGYDIGYDDNFHYSRRLPSQLPADKQRAIRETAALGIKSLGMKSSPAHVEIIYTANGPKIIEIGARTGGYRDRMHRLANGLQLYDIALDISLGKTPKIEALRDESCAVLELFPKTAGVFKGVKNEDRLRKLKSLDYLAIKQKVGDFVGKSSAGFKMCAIIVLHHKDKAAFDEDLDFVNQSVSIETQPE